MSFSFTFFERLYAVIADFASTVWQIFFVDTFHQYVTTYWDYDHIGGLSYFLQFIDDHFPDVTNVPIGFGLLFGAMLLFVAYTLVKWVTDLVL